MTTERYRPVSCGYHDLLEQASMHHERVVLVRSRRRTPGRERHDLRRLQLAEFVRFDAADGLMGIRPGKIISMRDA